MGLLSIRDLSKVSRDGASSNNNNHSKGWVNKDNSKGGDSSFSSQNRLSKDGDNKDNSKDGANKVDNKEGKVDKVDS